MTVLTGGVFDPQGANISLVGWSYNLFWVTVGNMLGGILGIAYPYYMMAKKNLS